MGIFLNSNIHYEAYKEIVSDTYFVDKSMLLSELIPALGKRTKYFCITRPRRFGKTVMAEMAGAFLEKQQMLKTCFQIWKFQDIKIIKNI